MKMPIPKFLFTVLCSAFLSFPSSANDIVGCNGFIKSEIDINFSKVEVKLMTKQGTLKDQTECAPNNGYYFLPLYDKGEYVLKVAAPPGWTFEPSEFILNADGVTDHCSLNKDINFEFKGFSIQGKVVGIGEQKGPPGIKVSLSSTDSKVRKTRLETTTAEDGSFQFKPVLPNQYLIEAQHPKWRFHKSQTSVRVVSDNVQVPLDSLVISGYDVVGMVTNDNEPLPNVHFVAFTPQSNKVVFHGCQTSNLSSFPAPVSVQDLKPVCYVTSDTEGRFLFPSLSPGQFTLVPFYQQGQIDIQPASLSFNVAHDSVVLDTKFQIMGFSMSGRILSSKESSGSPVPNAVVLIDDREVAHSSPDGQFVLENMRTGTYRLGVRTDDMRFSDVEIKASPTSTLLPPLHPTSYRVCGHVIPPSPARLVVFTSSSNGEVVFEETWTKEQTGEFCLFLSPGKYHASISVSDLDRTKAGLQFAPLKREVIVRDSVVTGINFSQLKAKLKGKVQCLDPALCVNFVLHLRNIATDQTMYDVVVKQGEYSVANMLPGEYEVILQNGGEWCWEQESVRVTVDSLVAVAPPLKQTGVAVSFVSSHATRVKYQMESESVAGEFNLSEGVTSTCVPRNGKYLFTPVSCHGYEQAQYKWQSGQGPVTLSAITHQFTSKIITDSKVDNLYITILNTQTRRVKKLGPLKPLSTATAHYYEYVFDTQLSPHEPILMTPSAPLLLFSPPTISHSGHNDCQESGEYFTAETGKLIEGHVVPSLAHVLVRLTNEDGVLVENGTTNSVGKYKFGPFRSEDQLIVSAEKEGYVLTGPDAQGNFRAHKLAEVIVEVKDKADARPLQGVLVSLSGGKSYRRNSLTGTDGKVSFLSLTPDQYYLRPMMKEYKFEPASQMINVSEAATAQVQWQGVRIAYSVLGEVTSLSGEPESGVTVEAVGQPNSNSDTACDQLKEDAITEPSGVFRIRGLKPQCNYHVRVSTEINQHIERALPAVIPVQVKDGDVTLNKRLIALRPISKCQVNVYIESKHLNTLTVKLYRSRTNEPLTVLKLKTLSHLNEESALIPLTQVPIPREGGSYRVVLETSLKRSMYDLARVKLVEEFQVDGSFKLVEFEFNPALITVSEHVLNDMNNVLLCIILAGLGLLTIGVNHYNKLGQYVERVKTMVMNFNTNTREKMTRREREEDETGAVLMEAVPVLKRKIRAKKIM
uniref:Nodal modulator 1 n=1 Tax=Cacopsylla melanoneura TaxID=428564 RepID=A0A8D8YDE6_9HEMI